jgi:L-asparaginase II
MDKFWKLEGGIDMEQSVLVFRGEYLESTHTAHIAVVNHKGKLLYSCGDPYRLTFPRSSMKPFQAIPLLETGTADHFSYEPADISLSCASHSGEPFHRSRVLAILERIGQDEVALQCGTHIPRDLESYKSLIQEGKDLTPVFSNCSGKHSGMIATAVYMNEDVSSYREVNHPVQQRIVGSIADICGYPQEKINISVDGCGVPVHQLPLASIAFGFAQLANPEEVESKQRSQVLQTIRDAMMAHPEMVGGTNRFDTDLMSVFNGRVVAKSGAEGVLCFGDVETGTGIALKIEDGNGRATSAVAMEVLKQLGIGDEHVYSQLYDYIHPPVKNMREDQIGMIRPQFVLSKLS